MKSLSFSILALLLVAFSHTSCAQGPAGISGKVSAGPQKKAVPRCSIHLQEIKSGQALTQITDSLGRFTYKGLKVVPYRLIVNMPGYATVTKTITAQANSAQVQIVLQATSTVLLKETKRLEDESARYKDKKAYGVMEMAVSQCAPSISYNSANTAAADYNRENYHHIAENGYKDARRDPLSTLSIDVDRASYSNIRRFLNQRQMPPADAVRVEEMLNYFPYQYPEPTKAEPFSITKEMTDCPWNTKHQLIRVGIKGKKIEQDNMKVNNLVFLVDVSGSMGSADKLPLLKSGLRLLVEQMRTTDRIALVAYAGAAGLVLPPTAGNHKQTILEAIDRFESGGSTAGGAGIQLAYKVAREHFVKEGNNRIILATDGDFNVGESSEGGLVRLIEKERESGVFLTVLGFGTGNLQDATMEQLADKGNGNYAYIDNLLEAKKVLVNEMGGTLVTIASDVKIQIEFNPAKVKAYRLVGYENRLLNAEDFNDDKKDAGDLGSGHTVTALYEIIPASSKESIPGTDSLKYQETKSVANNSDEVMTIKFRYKEPGTSSSKLIVSVLKDEKVALANAGDDFKFVVAVAEFGMLLRKSEYLGNTNYDAVKALALQSKGKDENGYRAEFISLVEVAQMLDRSVSVTEQD